MAGKTSKTPTARARPSARVVADQADEILADALKRERDYKRKGMSSVKHHPARGAHPKAERTDCPLALPHPDRLGQPGAWIHVRAELRAHKSRSLAVRQREPGPLLPAIRMPAQ